MFDDASLGRIDQSLKDALAQGAFASGSNLQIIYRYAEGNSTRLRELAEELVVQKPDLLLAPAGHFKFLRVWSVKFLHPRGRTRDC